jgi:hypothetical protein
MLNESIDFIQGLEICSINAGKTLKWERFVANYGLFI